MTLPRKPAAQPRFLEIRPELQRLELFCKGTVLARRMKCGQPRCPCHTDPNKRHGPYWEWTYKAAAKTVQREAQSGGRPALQSRLTAIPQVEIAAQPAGKTIAHGPGEFRQTGPSHGKRQASQSVARAPWLVNRRQRGPVMLRRSQKVCGIAHSCVPRPHSWGRLVLGTENVPHDCGDGSAERRAPLQKLKRVCSSMRRLLAEVPPPKPPIPPPAPPPPKPLFSEVGWPN